ncbi:hypothetical protein KKE78_01610 [Patescibacteria group bacterium]|nr:hypothetical protein [Patescibacteria group bacterium]
MNGDDKNTKKNSEEKQEEYFRELVSARIEALSDDLEVFFGDQNYTREELVKNIREGTELGKEIIESQLMLLRDMAEGKIYEIEDSTQLHA